MRELLARVDSRELAEWMAFEKFHGPIGHEYSDDLLAAIQEQLQLLCTLYGEGTFDENPVPEPRRWLRPNEIYASVQDDKAMSRDEFDRQF